MLYKPPNAHQRALRFRSSECVITGLPYSKNFESSSDASGWYFDGKYEYRTNSDNKGYQIRHYYRVPPFSATNNNSSNAFSPIFIIPENKSVNAYYKSILEIGNEGSSPSDVTVNMGITTGNTVTKSVSKTFKEYNSMITNNSDSLIEGNGTLYNNNRLVISTDTPSYTNYVNHRVVIQYFEVLYR